jgi:alpha-tubulin suppressor-like RCC1 family protein
MRHDREQGATARVRIRRAARAHIGAFAFGALAWLPLAVAVATVSSADTATSLATKVHHTCAVTTAGMVKCWGANAAGQLGDGTTSTRLTPVFVKGLRTGIVAVAVGREHSCALTRSGRVKCWGSNAHGQLGDGTTRDSSRPVAVQGLTTKAMAITAGYDHTCALMADGGVTCWGDNHDGELGDGTATERHLPVGVSGLASGVIAIAAGAYHTCALTGAGGVKCWGANDSGQLGDGTTDARPAAVDVFEKVSRKSIDAGDPACTQAQYHPEQSYYRYENVCDYPVSAYVCVGIYDPYIEYDPCRFAGDYRAHLRLSVGQTIDIEIARPGGGLVQFNEMQECPKGHTIVAEALTSFPCNRAYPVMNAASVTAGFDHSCMVTTGGGAKCWGNNSDGQIGDDSKAQRLIPVDVSGLADGVASIAAGERHTCAVTVVGGVECWGWNGHGQLGNGTTKSRRMAVDVVGLSGGAESVALGTVSCALTSAGGLQCWGENDNGELGDGTTIERHTPVAVEGF